MSSTPSTEHIVQQPSSSNNVVIMKPSIPYVSVIPDGVFVGRTIVIKGVVLSGSQSIHRFSINLCCGLLVEGDHTDDKALHFNARFDKDTGWFSSSDPDTDIVINSQKNNKWGPEERYANRFNEGQPFEVSILALQDYFKISVNGKHLCDYTHRLAMQQIETIYITGNVQLDYIEYIDNKVGLHIDYLSLDYLN